MAPQILHCQHGLRPAPEYINSGAYGCRVLGCFWASHSALIQSHPASYLPLHESPLGDFRVLREGSQRRLRIREGMTWAQSYTANSSQSLDLIVLSAQGRPGCLSLVHTGPCAAVPGSPVPAAPPPRSLTICWPLSWPTLLGVPDDCHQGCKAPVGLRESALYQWT